MSLSPRMAELQTAMNRYGEMTVKNFKIIHAFGDSIVGRLQEYLGEGASVLGVPPAGEYRTNGGDYRGAKFSTHHNGALSLKPIQMGIAIGIPHSKDDGMYWPRLVIEFAIVGDAVSVQIGDALAMRGFPLEPTALDVERVCEAIYEFTKDVLENPVKIATAVGTGKFGFV